MFLAMSEPQLGPFRRVPWTAGARRYARDGSQPRSIWTPRSPAVACKWLNPKDKSRASQAIFGKIPARSHTCPTSRRGCANRGADRAATFVVQFDVRLGSG